jgi:Bacterial Ig domain
MQKGPLMTSNSKSRRTLHRTVVVTAIVTASFARVLGLGSTGSFSAMAPAAAGADPLADCTTTTGVLVAVDFSHWGGSIERGCDATPTTGYAALQVAGFTTEGDQQDGDAFICRINDEPSPSQDPCITTPPGSAYWSYWHADAGQTTWTPSSLGATIYQPPAGSIDGWAFGAGRPPTFTPAVARSTESTTVVVPANGATVSGTTTLDASATNATSVQFWLFGRSYGTSGKLLCRASATIYGWLCRWDTTTVPKGSYRLRSEAFNAAGSAFSSAIAVKVKR